MQVENEPDRQARQVQQRVAAALRRRRLSVVVAIALAAAAMFVVDLSLPLGVGAGVPYALLVLVGLWYERTRPTLVAAGAATLLNLVGMFLSPPGVISLGTAALNRGIAVLVIWALALVLLRQKRTKQRLLEEQRGTRGLLDVVEVAIIQLDTRGRVTMINRKGCEMLGYPEGQIIGKDWFEEFLPEPLRPEVREVYGRLMAGEIELARHHENPILTRDGEQKIIAWHNTLIRDPDSGIVGTMSSGMDITERKKTEEELRKREALAQVGQLATVVAHEVRNPLAGIAGALQIMGGRLADDSPDREVIGEILERIDALNELVGSLLLYARPRTPQSEPLRFDDLLHGTVELARADPDLVAVRVELDTKRLVVAGDGDLLRILFTNLLLNAGQAMEGRGEIRIDARTANGRCQVRVSDTGPGMTEDVRERIFEPFFTTRNRGTGLGMAICKQVVEAHGGEIDIECPPQGGTTVVVSLPV